MKNIVIIGSTGSIGTQAIEIINENEEYSIFALSAGKNLSKLSDQVHKYKPKYYDNLDKEIIHNCTSKLMESSEIVKLENVDFVFFASSGSDALKPIVEALKSGKDIALTNKEVIVTYGPLLLEISKKTNATIFPIDSEPSAIWQCLSGEKRKVHQIILTASGGAFRDYEKNDLMKITPAEATKHPNWVMGEKITVDSSTMMNKIFEIVETSYLFNIPIDQIEVLIHRESIVHSMVEFEDSSILAQLSKPDMRLPIQYALSNKSNIFNYQNRLDLNSLKNLSFNPVQSGQYLCYDFSINYIRKGPIYISALSFVNEMLVNLFLTSKIHYLSIPVLMKEILYDKQINLTMTFDNLTELKKDLKKLTLDKSKQYEM